MAWEIIFREMPGTIVVGLQWGDEGKGKVVDLLSQNSLHIVRAQGGNNAGHTIKTNEREIALHLVPSGILNPHVQAYIAGGCLIDPGVLIQEISTLEKEGIDVLQRLHISPYAHIIFPFHCMLDKLYEARKSNHPIGTTGRGIGPCMSDRAARIGIRVAELIRPSSLKTALHALGMLKNEELEKIFGKDPFDLEQIYGEYAAYGEILRPFVKDVEGRICEALIRDESVLFEGAHGTLLDGVMGSYPFVTASSTLAAGVCAGAGCGPTFIDQVFGVLKAYTTRVGEGPLPTAVAPDEMGFFQQAQDLREIGTTTGRARRIGWLDLVLARYAVEINGVHSLALTKLDVLDLLPEIKLCVGYALDGEKIEKPPPLIEDLARVVPIYEVLPGWQVSTKEARKIRSLPQEARAFIQFIEEYCNVPVGLISVGPGREETIEIDEEFM